MTDYANGKNVLLRRPEPGRPAYPAQTPPKVEKSNDINVDVNAIADAVIKAISNKMPVNMQGSGQVVSTVMKDDFDSSGSLKRLADAMTSGGNKESNLGGLGKIKENKKDKKETDKTVDMLSKLGD